MELRFLQYDNGKNGFLFCFFFIKYQIYNDCQFGLVIINIYRILICWHIIKQKDHNFRKEKGVNK